MFSDKIIVNHGHHLQIDNPSSESQPSGAKRGENLVWMHGLDKLTWPFIAIFAEISGALPLQAIYRTEHDAVH